MEALLVSAGLSYTAVRVLHIGAVVISGGLFLVRGVALQAGMRWVMSAPLRYLSYAIDTVLLGAGLMLVAFLPASVFDNGWLAVKLALLVAYVVFGSLALKRGRTRRGKRRGLLIALALYGCMFAIARTHDPLGPLRLLSGGLPELYGIPLGVV